MTFIATTTVKIATGYEPGDHDIDEGDGAPVATPTTDPRYPRGYPASIIEKTKQVFDTTTGTRRTVRYAIGRISSKFSVVDGDRIHDQRSGKVYLVDEITEQARTIAGLSDVVLTLRITD